MVAMQVSGSYVATVRAVDRDSGRFGRLHYRAQVPHSCNKLLLYTALIHQILVVKELKNIHQKCHTHGDTLDVSRGRMSVYIQNSSCTRRLYLTSNINSQANSCETIISNEPIALIKINF